MLVAVGLNLACGCAQEQLLTLGRAALDAGSAVGSAGPAFEFEAPVLVPELFSETKDDNPTLTWDMKEIYFSSKRGGDNSDVWWAERAELSEPFSNPELLSLFSGEGFETSPAVDGDGLTFWFARRVEDSLTGLDIQRAIRLSQGDEWGEPTLVAELNSDTDDIPRPTGAGGRVMPLGSRRTSTGYLSFSAERASSSDPFMPPVLLDELVEDGFSTADAFLSDDGLVILFNHVDADELGDLFVATRERLDLPFSGVALLETINTAADERDPWLSPDGNTLYFASDREGSLAIYRATRKK